MGLVKLFLVEDHLLMRQAIARALSITDKYEVTGHTGSPAELWSNPGCSQADVIILDMAIARHSSLETLLELKKQGINTPVLILSGDESHHNMKAALNAGARGFIPKKSDLSEMEFAIDAVAKGGTYVSPCMTDSFLSNVSENANGHGTNMLSSREREIFLMLAEGKKNRDIGSLLGISTRTVDTHRSNILKKLGLHSNAELARLAIAEGLLSLERHS